MIPAHLSVDSLTLADRLGRAECSGCHKARRVCCDAGLWDEDGRTYHLSPRCSRCCVREHTPRPPLPRAPINHAWADEIVSAAVAVLDAARDAGVCSLYRDAPLGAALDRLSDAAGCDGPRTGDCYEGDDA